MRLTGKLVFDKERGIYHPPITEEHVVAEIIQRLAWNQIKVFRIAERIPGMSKRISTPGIPDLIGWLRIATTRGPLTVPLFVEVKRPGGVRRPAQIRFIGEAKSDGCAAFFAESWADVVGELKECGVTLK